MKYKSSYSFNLLIIGRTLNLLSINLLTNLWKREENDSLNIRQFAENFYPIASSEAVLPYDALI